MRLYSGKYRSFSQPFPLILAEICQTIPISVFVRIIRVIRVQSPVVSPGINVPYPSPMLYFPSVRHPIAIRVGIGRIGG